MNKKIFLLPFLAVSLLVGCTGAQTNPSGGQSQSGSGSQGQKEIWEEDEVEGESTFAQVKAGEAEQYYTVRGTVVANSGSTLAIYRKGQFLYCYNFKAEAHENLADHPLGAYVEIHAQSSKYEGSTQLTAYNVGAEKTSAGYDLAASLKVLAEKGEEVAPYKITNPADLANGIGAGMLMEVDFVPHADYTFTVNTNANQDLEGDVNGAKFSIRLEKFLPQAVQTALLEANPAQFADHATYKMVLLGAATSSGNVRGLMIEGSSWSKTADAEFADPTSVLLESTETTVVVGRTLALDWAVLPDNAKQAVTFESSDENVATVDEAGVVTGVAAGPVTITAAAVVDPTKTAELALTVVEPEADPLAAPLKLDFSEQAAIDGELNAAKALEVIQAAAGESNADLIEEVSEVSKVYAGNGTSGAHNGEAGLIKFGTSSVKGKIVIILNAKFNKVVIKCHDFYASSTDHPTNSNYISVNGSDETLLPYNSTGAWEDMTFENLGDVTALTIEMNKRGTIREMTLSYVGE